MITKLERLRDLRLKVVIKRKRTKVGEVGRTQPGLRAGSLQSEVWFAYQFPIGGSLMTWTGFGGVFDYVQTIGGKLPLARRVVVASSMVVSPCSCVALSMSRPNQGREKPSNVKLETTKRPKSICNGRTDGSGIRSEFGRARIHHQFGSPTGASYL